MTYWNKYINYKNDPQLDHEMTLEELIDKMGSDEVFKNTAITDDLKARIIDFFLYDRLCDNEKKFLWFFRRRINTFYPIYKAQMDMWTERQSRDIFYDLYKDRELTHNGTTTNREKLIRESTNELKRIVEDILAGKINTDTTSNTTTNSEGTASGKANTTNHGTTISNGTTENDGTSTTNENGKTRGFGFNYPESNYTGGVIPYDLDNNPSIEFINTQQDAVNRNTSTTTTHDEGSSHNETEDNSAENTTTENSNKDTTTSDGSVNELRSTDEKRTSDGTTTSKEAGTVDKDGSEIENYEDKEKYRGDNLIDLAQKMIEQIPQTNFFLDFMKKLEPCFQRVYLYDEILEDEGVYFY